MPKKVSKEDLNKMSYPEYEAILGTLIKKIEEHFKVNNIHVDVIAPILRSGGVPGMMLAVHFEVIKILPVHFKHFYDPKEIKQVMSLPELFHEMPETPVILITENNTITGSTAKKAVEAIKKAHPNARLFYATTVKAYDGPEEFDGVEKVFWGALTDENQTASPEMIKELGLRPKVTISPWENVDYEMKVINAWLE